MEAFEAILSIVIIAVAVISKNKKKKTKRVMEAIRQEVMTPPSGHPAEMLPVMVQESMVMPVMDGQKVEAAPAKVEKTSLPFTEGKDPCHDDLFASREEEPILLSENAEQTSSVGQELVRGFVLGEILTAPKFKTVRRN